MERGKKSTIDVQGTAGRTSIPGFNPVEFEGICLALGSLFPP
jgi:hypothetical protein